MSVKYQIVLPDSLSDELKRVSARLKVRRSELIREAIVARLKGYRRTRGSDPFAAITGLVESGDTGVSTRVDEILYE